MAKTKIVILQLKQVIYTVVFACLGILLLILLFLMFWPEEDQSQNEQSQQGYIEQSSSGEVSSEAKEETETGRSYQAGIYTSQVEFGDTIVNLQVALDEDRVKSIDLIEVDESITTMYPLMEPAVKQIANQLTQGVEVSEVVLSEDSQYTEEIILNKISDILSEHEKK